MTERTVGFMLGRVDCNDGVASHCETLIGELKKIGWKVVLITGPVTYDESCKYRHTMLSNLAKSWVRLDELHRTTEQHAEAADFSIGEEDAVLFQEARESHWCDLDVHP